MDRIGLPGDLRERVLEDLRLVIKDAEDLLRSTGQQASESFQSARTRLESTLSNARSGLSDLESRVSTSARDAFETTDQYVHSNPWQAVGVGALAGLVIGLWIGRQ